MTPQDLLATIYHSLGINQTQYLTRPDGRLSRLLDDGEPILELFR
jgi:hypothetical protein